MQAEAHHRQPDVHHVQPVAALFRLERRETTPMARGHQTFEVHGAGIPHTGDAGPMMQLRRERSKKGGANKFHAAMYILESLPGELARSVRKLQNNFFFERI